MTRSTAISMATFRYLRLLTTKNLSRGNVPIDVEVGEQALPALSR